MRCCFGRLAPRTAWVRPTLRAEVTDFRTKLGLLRFYLSALAGACCSTEEY